MIAGDWFLLGAPWDCSGSGRGEQEAPDAFDKAGISSLVGRDLGDATTLIETAQRDDDTGVLGLWETVRAASALADVLAAAIDDLPGLRALVVGGDCSIPFWGLSRAAQAGGFSWTVVPRRAPRLATRSCSDIAPTTGRGRRCRPRAAPERTSTDRCRDHVG